MTTALEAITSRIVPVLRDRGVRRAAVFGSRVRGEEHPGSDLDLLVELPPESTLLDLVGLSQDLEDLLGFKVDVLTYNSIHPDLRDDIMEEQVGIL